MLRVDGGVPLGFLTPAQSFEHPDPDSALSFRMFNGSASNAPIHTYGM